MTSKEYHKYLVNINGIIQRAAVTKSHQLELILKNKLYSYIDDVVDRFDVILVSTNGEDDIRRCSNRITADEEHSIFFKVYSTDRLSYSIHNCGGAYHGASARIRDRLPTIC